MFLWFIEFGKYLVQQIKLIKFNLSKPELEHPQTIIRHLVTDTHILEVHPFTWLHCQ